MKEYVSLLDKFYKETRFHSFFVNHSDFYSKVEANANVIVSQIDTAWFMDFFGQRFDMSNIWIVPLMGPHNFMDRRVDKSGKIYRNCALGTTRTDSLGYPTFDSRHLRTLIHEVCHNYNNPICEKYEDDFRQVILFFPDFFPTCVDNHGNNGQIGQIPRKIVQTPPLPRGVDYHSLKTPCCNTEFLLPLHQIIDNVLNVRC